MTRGEIISKIELAQVYAEDGAPSSALRCLDEARHALVVWSDNQEKLMREMLSEEG